MFRAVPYRRHTTGSVVPLPTAAVSCRNRRLSCCFWPLVFVLFFFFVLFLFLDVFLCTQLDSVP